MNLGIVTVAARFAVVRADGDGLRPTGVDRVARG